MAKQQTNATRIIAIEGPIGVGKTTLARRLAQEFGTDLMLEGAAQNPFLEKFYADPARFALPAQVHFLFQRVEQLESFRQNDLFRPVYIADYLIEKDRIFAQLTLEPEEFAIYELLYQRVFDGVSTPDLVIYLQAPVSILLDRIGRRGLRYEQDIDPNYLESLCRAYREFFDGYELAPVLFVNTEGVNFADGERDFEGLLEVVRAGINGKRHYADALA